MSGAGRARTQDGDGLTDQGKRPQEEPAPPTPGPVLQMKERVSVARVPSLWPFVAAAAAGKGSRCSARVSPLGFERRHSVS